MGNLTRETTQSGYTDYGYDMANWMTSAGGVPLTWSDNGNLLADGTSTYQWDHANRLIGVAQGADSYVFSYSGLGDRLRQTVNGVPTSYTLDLEAGLTQVLADGANAYLYGHSRLGEEQPGGWVYHLPDALGSVRQLADGSGGVTLAHAFEPYGESLASSGAGDSAYGFTGEWTDGTGLVHLRARYYAPYLNRFTSRDPWEGDPNRPVSYNAWAYAHGNPVNHVDPSGMCLEEDMDGRCDTIPNLPPLPGRSAYCETDGCNTPWCGFPRYVVGEEYVGEFHISAYYIPHESQFQTKDKSTRARIYAVAGASGEFLSKDDRDYTDEEDDAQKAEKEFLYGYATVCMNGKGMLRDGRYIGCTTSVKLWDGEELAPEYRWPKIGFYWQDRGNQLAFRTVASCSSGSLPEDTWIRIPELKPYLSDPSRDPAATGLLRVNDTGGDLCPTDIDLFVGEGRSGFRAYGDLMNWSYAHSSVAVFRVRFGSAP